MDWWNAEPAEKVIQGYRNKGKTDTWNGRTYSLGTSVFLYEPTKNKKNFLLFQLRTASSQHCREMLSDALSYFKLVLEISNEIFLDGDFCLDPYDVLTCKGKLYAKCPSPNFNGVM